MYKVFETPDGTLHFAPGFRLVRRQLTPTESRLRRVAAGDFHLEVGPLGVTVVKASLRTPEQARTFLLATEHAWEVYYAMATNEKPDLTPRT